MHGTHKYDTRRAEYLCIDMIHQLEVGMEIHKSLKQQLEARMDSKDCFKGE